MMRFGMHGSSLFDVFSICSYFANSLFNARCSQLEGFISRYVTIVQE